MLGEANVYPTIPVKDLDQARDFYERALGLTSVTEDEGGIYYESGNSNVYVYTSPDNAGKNPATSASWSVRDVAATVEQLKAKGITFEHYDDIPGTTREGDIHTMGTIHAAWFRDPSGNILAFDDNPEIANR